MMNFKSYLPGAAFLALLSFAAGCGSDGGDGGGGPAAPVDLGTAGTFAILAESGITSVPGTAGDNHITGDIGVSPLAATSITGFELDLDASGEFSTSPQVTGSVYAADYAVPTPAMLTAAVLDMTAAYNDARGRAPDVTELGAGNIDGMNLGPGVYKWGTDLLIPTGVTLTGNGTDVWIFQVAGNLTLINAAQVNLAGGALPKNVFWQVAGSAVIGTTAHFQGVALAHMAITLGTGAEVDGRLLAKTAVTMDGNVVVEPAP